MLSAMNDQLPLQLDSRLLCPHCRRWHRVVKGHTEGTDYTLAMLYFPCRGGQYYAGQLGQTSRHPSIVTGSHDGRRILP
jgi:hypothetical protein